MNINMLYLAHIIHAVINIYCAVFSGKTWFKLARIMSKMIHTNNTISTRSIPFTIAHLSHAEGYFSFTLTSGKSSPDRSTRMSRQDQYMWRYSCRYFQCNHQRWFHILFHRIRKDLHTYVKGFFVNLMIVQNMI